MPNRNGLITRRPRKRYTDSEQLLGSLTCQLYSFPTLLLQVVMVLLKELLLKEPLSDSDPYEYVNTTTMTESR